MSMARLRLMIDASDAYYPRHACALALGLWQTSSGASPPPKRPIAGYKPPKDVSTVPDSVIQQAKQMLAPDAVDRLITFLKVGRPSALAQSSLPQRLFVF